MSKFIGQCPKCGKVDQLFTERRVGSGGDWFVTDCRRCDIEVHAVKDVGQDWPRVLPGKEERAPKELST